LRLPRDLTSVGRTGAHKIIPKMAVSDRTALSPAQGAELMILTMVVGEAMTLGLNRRSVDVARINYQDNGNWGVFRPNGPYLHVHLYGRAKSATTQHYGDALFFPHRETGYYDDHVPLGPDDVKAIREEIERLLATPKYRHVLRPGKSGLGIRLVRQRDGNTTESS